ncbi:MAG: hypothetical protein ACR2PY_02475, partial [Salinispira sp.]
GIMRLLPIEKLCSTSGQAWKRVSMNDLYVLSIGTGYSACDIHGPDSLKNGGTAMVPQGTHS